MGYWVSLYLDAPEKLAAVVGSKQPALATKFESDNPEFLDRLINGDYEPGGESDDAGYLVQAFEIICQNCCPSRCTVEIVVDEELFPEIWRLAWGAEAVPFDLPLSSYGTPAVSFWDSSQLGGLIQALSAIDHDGVARKTARSSGFRAEVSELIGVLAEAAAKGRGVLVFVSE